MATGAHPGFVAVLRREGERLRRDRWDLGMLTWIPLLLCALVWWTFSAGVARDLPIAVVDRDTSANSRALVRLLDASPGIAVLPVASETEAMALLRQRRAFGVVVVPDDFQQRLLTGRASSVAWAYNAQFAGHSGSLARDVRTVVATFSAGVELAAREKRGTLPVQALQQFEPVQLRITSLFNENANYEAFLALSAIPGLAQIFIALAAVTAVGRELRHGTVPQWLEAAGGRWWPALFGKLAWPALAFAVQALLFVALLAGLRGWTVLGSAPMLVLGLLAFVAAYLALGVLIVAATLSLRMALSAAAFITAPAFAFAGQAFPLADMPAAARAWAEALPLTHYLQLQGRAWLAGAPATYALADLLVLCAMAAGFLALAWLLLRRRALQPAHWGAT